MWLLYALFAAVLWGFEYTFAEKVLKYISVPVFLALELFVASIILAIMAWISGAWQKDVMILSSSSRVSLFFVLGIIAFTTANVLICTAIQSKNATLSSLIEISYPLFIALMTWLLFRENELSWNVGIGGALIFSGLFIIYYFNH